MQANLLKKAVAEATVFPEDQEKKNGLLAKAVSAGAQVAGLGHQATRIKTAVTDAVTEAIEDTKRETRRALKRSYNAAEDLVDETAYRVKHHPLRSVAIAFGAGALVGVIVTGIGKKWLKA